MKHRARLTTVCLLIAMVVVNVVRPPTLVHSQGSEPRFSFPSARRFVITSYFDHTNPDVSYNTIDNEVAIYTTERGLRSNNCFECYTSGSVQVCGYYTVLQNAANCGAAGGQRIYYDMHPAFDYGFPMYTPITAAALGTAYRRAILGSAIAIDHGNGYWTKYGHVDPTSRIADSTSVVRGQQVALSSNTGTGAAHLHFETRFNGEYGTVFDPYGWSGPWYTDPWNQPFQHTLSWWASSNPIPMGYRDQNHTVQGPHALISVMESTWRYELNGLPGSPVSNLGSNNCPNNYGNCQFFERGYLRSDYTAVNYHPYNETLIGRVHYVTARNANTILSIQNLGDAPAQVSVIFSENGHVVDSRTYKMLASNTTWQLNTQLALQELTDRFIGTAAVYSDQSLAYSINHVHPLPTVFLPLTIK